MSLNLVLFYHDMSFCSSPTSLFLKIWFFSSLFSFRAGRRILLLRCGGENSATLLPKKNEVKSKFLMPSPYCGCELRCGQILRMYEEKFHRDALFACTYFMSCFFFTSSKASFLKDAHPFSMLQMQHQAWKRAGTNETRHREKRQSAEGFFFSRGRKAA